MEGRQSKDDDGRVQATARRRRWKNGVGIIVSEEISKTVVRVERWKGRKVMAWLMIRKQMMCVMSVYGPQTRRTEAEKEEFRDALERMIGLVELELMLCIAGDFNAHVGVVEPVEEESVGRYGWGARNREGRPLTELDLVIVRKQQLWKIKDCKAVAGEHVTTQHKPVVFVVRMQKKKQTKSVGRRTIKWWRCKDEVAVEHKERMTVKYDELSEEVGGLEEEWKKYKEAFVGAAEELCGRTSGKGGMSRSSNQGWWTSEVAEAVCEKKEAWEEIEKTKERGNEPDARMIHTYGQKKRAAKRAVGKARRDKEADVYSKLDEDGGKKMINKLARDRDYSSKDVKGGTVMKDRNGKLVTEQEAVLKVWESYFKELLNQERNNNDLELRSYVEGKVELSNITDTEMQIRMKGMKKGRTPGIDEMRVEMVMEAGDSGISWTKMLLNTCMRQGKVPEEWRTGLIVPIWKKKGDVQDPWKYRGITLLSHIMKLLERILDVRIRKKVEQEFGEEHQ